MFGLKISWTSSDPPDLWCFFERKSLFFAWRCRKRSFWPSELERKQLQIIKEHIQTHPKMAQLRETMMSVSLSRLRVRCERSLKTGKSIVGGWFNLRQWNPPWKNRSMTVYDITSGKQPHNYGSIHHFEWVNHTNFPWPCSLAMFVCQRAKSPIQVPSPAVSHLTTTSKLALQLYVLYLCISAILLDTFNAG